MEHEIEVEVVAAEIYEIKGENWTCSLVEVIVYQVGEGTL